jgi:1-acyl-sn-glycerol-3-phosphate acyltransferase
MSFYNGARIVFSPLVRLIFGIKRTGTENLPQQGPLIICSNHRSNYDPVILGASLKRDVRFMAKAELFKNPFLRILITLLGAYPIERGKGDTAALNKFADILNSGTALIIFAEGHRNKKGGSPMRFKSGVSLLAYKTHATVLPVAIVRDGKVGPFRRNEVRVGKPLSYDELGFTDGSLKNLRDTSRLLHDKVDDLIFSRS